MLLASFTGVAKREAKRLCDLFGAFEAPAGSFGTKTVQFIWVFPKIGVPQNGWFMMETPNKIEDLGVPLFLDTHLLKFCYVDASICHTLRSFAKSFAQILLDVHS